MVYYLTQFTAVNGISKIYREFAEIHHLAATQANLFIRNKANINITMKNILVFSQGFEGNHHISNSSLIISAQYRGTVADNQITANIFVQLRMLAYFDIDLFFCIKENVAALIILNHLGMNLRRHVNVNSVKMSNPTNSRNLMIAFWKICREFASQHTVFADFQVNKTKLSQISLQQLCQLPLTLRTGNNSSTLYRLGRNCSIAEKSFSKTFLNIHSSYFLSKSKIKNLIMAKAPPR